MNMIIVSSSTPICYMKSDVEFFTFLGSMLNFFRPMAICLFLCMLFLNKAEWNLNIIIIIILLFLPMHLYAIVEKSLLAVQIFS